MSRMKMFIGVVVTALALGSAGTASAQNEDTSQQVDWEEAAEYAELMDTWVNSNDVEMATYYDEAQNVLWSQPSAMSVEEGAAALAEGPEYAGTLDTSTWILPTNLWLCLYDEDEDSSCTYGYKWGSDDIVLEGTSGTVATYHAMDTECLYENIERVYAKGTSYYTDFCNSTFRGHYYHGTWDLAEDYWCTELTTRLYYLDDSVNIDDFEYDPSDSAVAVAGFRWTVNAAYWYSRIYLNRCY